MVRFVLDMCTSIVILSCPCNHNHVASRLIFWQTLLIISGVEQKHQSLFYLMELPFLSAEVKPHIEPFF